MEELRADVEALEESMEDLAATVERLGEVAEDDAADVTEADLARAWFEAVVEHRFHGLMLADLRWELTERGGGAEAGGIDPTAAAGIESRIAALADRRETIGDRLDGLTRVQWLRQHAEALSALDREFAGLEPPIDWEDVSETLESLRAEGDDGEG